GAPGAAAPATGSRPLALEAAEVKGEHTARCQARVVTRSQRQTARLCARGPGHQRRRPVSVRRGRVPSPGAAAPAPAARPGDPGVATTARLDVPLPTALAPRSLPRSLP